MNEMKSECFTKRIMLSYNNYRYLCKFNSIVCC